MTSWSTYRPMNENSPLIVTIKDWLDDASRQLVYADIPSARLDAELLLAHTLRKPRTWLHIHGDKPLSERDQDIARARLDLRLDRVPVAYIIGHKEFYGRMFKVTTATLIPRPESEALIDLLDIALPRNLSLINDRSLRLVDVGTGSGCLGITAKLEYPELDVTLIDNSRYALTVAEQNAEVLEADVTTLAGSLLSPYPYVADIIIANLPYVDESWQRSPETNHEPAEALFAHDEGLVLIKELILQTKTKLARGGGLILEADPVQHKAIIAFASGHGLILAETKDYGLLLEKLA